ncbi:FlgK family flagellar hook-associated protein [Pararhodospirillum photometricum]|uniref:Flagellar hook-associated protein 1 n=1 Tax=Pararhodospirillum photometricum DSM 122 TaxID=1150469 RepID=H6SMD5_PARPM|nr:hypothetical protein [Pararhodospirillum photometricum]CCG06818.1 Putative uncharacterized protein [Pararhodospirillum photometricum DSM 122]
MKIGSTFGSAVSGLQNARKSLEALTTALVRTGATPAPAPPRPPEPGTRRPLAAPRVVREHLARGFRAETSRLAHDEAHAQYYEALAEALGTPVDPEGLPRRVKALGEEALAFATTPEAPAEPVVATAQGLAQAFNALAERLAQVRHDVDEALAEGVAALNAHIGAMSALNDRIAVMDATDARPRRAQREALLRQINDLMEVGAFERSSGVLALCTPPQKTRPSTLLLDVSPVALSYLPLGDAPVHETWRDGGAGALLAGVIDITAQVQGGRLGALMDLRDRVLPDVQAELDALAARLMGVLNPIHALGVSFPIPTPVVRGSARFVAPHRQRLALLAGDSAVILCGADGRERAKILLSQILGDTARPLADVLGALEDWLHGQGLSAARVSLEDERLVIDLHAPDLTLTWRDDGGVLGINDDGQLHTGWPPHGVDRLSPGLAQLFGLGLLFDAPVTEELMDSTLLPAGWALPLAGTLTFTLATDPDPPPPRNVRLRPQWTLRDIANALNTEDAVAAVVEAVVVREGAGNRLRLRARAPGLLITSPVPKKGKTTVMAVLGVAPSLAGTSARLTLAPVLAADPSRLARSVPEPDPLTGTHALGPGVPPLALRLAAAFSQGLSFDPAGRLGKVQKTLADYAALSLTEAASNARLALERKMDQALLTDLLDLRLHSEGPLDLEGEEAQGRVWEQLYETSAAIRSVTLDLMDILKSAMR